MAEICAGANCSSFPVGLTMTVTRSPSRPTRYGTIFISSLTSSWRRPMNRLIENTVFSGLVTAWRFAT
jgi:hypothetical protein